MTKEPMTKMPKEARSIARIIRKAVKRPTEKKFVWSNGLEAWRTKNHQACPMGMHPKATEETPTDSDGFPSSKNNQAINRFAGWWDYMKKDHLKDAIDAIWGKRR